MSEAFITRRGGGGAFAIVLVNYPAGATVTCTNSSGKKNISSTQVLFYVKKGTLPISCVVTATDGVNTATRTVSITYEGQSITVTLNYKLFLYDQGNEYIDLTGGWVVNSKRYSSVYVARTPTLTKGSASMTLSLPSGNVYSGSLISTNKINVSNFTSLHILYDISCTGNSDQKAFCLLFGDIDATTYQSTASCQTESSKYVGGTTTTNVELSVDISQLSSLYVGLGLNNQNQDVAPRVTVKQIWLLA